MEALIAERRAVSSTDRAWRSAPLRGVPSRGRAIASRAARIASSGSDFAPLRRPARNGAVQLDDDLRGRQQETAQTGTMAAGALDRPGPQRRVVVGELHQLGIALGCRLDRDLVEDTTGRGVDHGRGVSVDVGVDADDDIDHLTQIGQTGHAFSPSPDGDVVPVRDGRFGRTVMRHARRCSRQAVKLLIRPAPPTGPGPATTSGQVAARHEASHNVGHTRGHQPQPSTIRLRKRSSQSQRRLTRAVVCLGREQARAKRIPVVPLIRGDYGRHCLAGEHLMGRPPLPSLAVPARR